MINIEIDTSKVLKHFERLRDKLENQTPVMATISKKMEEAVTENFEQQGRPKWAPLSPLTLERREKEGHSGKPILHNSGTLKTMIEADYGPDYAVVGTNSPYAAIHQFGSEGLPGGVIKPKSGKYLTIPVGDGTFRKVKSVTIPARPFLTLADEDYNDIEDAIIKYLEV